MNQNLTYTYSADPRAGASSGQSQAPSSLSFHPTFHTSSYSAGNAFHSGSNFLPNTSGYKMPATSQPQSGMRLAQPAIESDDRRIAALLDSYFVDSTPASNWNQQGGGGGGGGQSIPNQAVAASYAGSGASGGPSTLSVTTKGAQKMMTPEKRDKERVKRLKQAEAARLRYHRLTPDQKKDLNMKRTLAQKRKRQREKELEELDNILRQSNDIQEDPEVTDQLRERRMRAKWAEAARARYQRMSSEERRQHNNKRRIRQMHNAIGGKDDVSPEARHLLSLPGDNVNPGEMKEEVAIRKHMKEQNMKKAEAARQRYHRMSDEEKRAYNQRRTEAFRRRRMEEEMLLAMPIGRINGEALDRAQQIVVRNAKRAEAARLRYQRMTPDQRKMYNQVRMKRYTPKRKRAEEPASNTSMMTPQTGGNMQTVGGLLMPKKNPQEDELDALSTLERDVMKRTAQAQQTLARRYVVPGTSNGSSQLQSTPTQQQLLHPSIQPMSSYSAATAAAANQGLMGHMQPILNPYGGGR